MTISATLVAPHQTLGALSTAIVAAKGGDPLAPVTVVVPTNTCGVMTRRALGRAGGIAGVDMVTLNRLAELIAGPGLAAAGRSPMSTPVIDLTISSILAADPGPFGVVADHPSTIVALRNVHQELRLVGADARQRLAAESLRGRQAVAVSNSVTEALRATWYDEGDLFEDATTSINAAIPSGLRHLIVYLPQELSRLAERFIAALGRQIDVELVLAVTGRDEADADSHRLIATLDARTTDRVRYEPPTARPVGLVSTTDADDEVRVAIRLVVEAARAGTPFERIAVLWPAQRPYARLVEHHLRAADLPWNGRPGTTVVERLAPRLVLDLLDVDRRGLRRRTVFDLLADVPARDDEGAYLPTAEWERVSRRAGVARDDDWDRRLTSISVDDRWRESATALRSFVQDLRSTLGHPAATRPWSEWAAWCTDQAERRLGRHTIERLPEQEYRAWESLTRALDRLGHLDEVGGVVTRHQFRSTLVAELEAAPAREGRVGDGITAGPLAGAVGLDVDVTIVLGAAEGLLPPTPRSDPLLSEADRVVTGLPTADARAVRLHRLLLATLASSAVTLTFPRGDLRATSQLQPSRWITEWLGDVHAVPSHHAGLEATPFPTSASEHRLRDRYHSVRSGAGLGDDAGGDPTLLRGISTITARGSDAMTVYDGDLSGADVPRLDTAVSPSRLENWVACPHAYFAHYLLNVDPIDEPSGAITISGRDRGSTQHRALDRFHRAVIDGLLPQPGRIGWTAEHRAALMGFFDEACDITERRGRTGRPAFWADARARMLADLLGWLDHDDLFVRRRGATVLASEFSFGGDGRSVIHLPSGRAIELKGSIDRVDRTDDGTLVVTDHKSGRKENFVGMTLDDPTVGGTLFQLPAYTAAARAEFGTPGTLVHAEYGLLAKGGYDRPGMTMTADVDQRVREALALVVDGIETGYFPHRPEPPGWRMFVACEFCEPDHLGTVERWGEWERKQHDPRLAPWFGVPEDTT